MLAPTIAIAQHVLQDGGAGLAYKILVHQTPQACQSQATLATAHATQAFTLPTSVPLAAALYVPKAATVPMALHRLCAPQWGVTAQLVLQPSSCALLACTAPPLLLCQWSACWGFTAQLAPLLLVPALLEIIAPIPQPSLSAPSVGATVPLGALLCRPAPQDFTAPIHLSALYALQGCTVLLLPQPSLSAPVGATVHLGALLCRPAPQDFTAPIHLSALYALQGCTVRLHQLARQSVLQALIVQTPASNCPALWDTTVLQAPPLHLLVLWAHILLLLLKAPALAVLQVAMEMPQVLPHVRAAPVAHTLEALALPFVQCVDLAFTPLPWQPQKLPHVLSAALDSIP